jgi:hypothetical protein
MYQKQIFALIRQFRTTRTKIVLKVLRTNGQMSGGISWNANIYLTQISFMNTVRYLSEYNVSQNNKRPHVRLLKLRT